VLLVRVKKVPALIWLDDLCVPVRKDITACVANLVRKPSEQEGTHQWLVRCFYPPIWVSRCSASLFSTQIGSCFVTVFSLLEKELFSLFAHSFTSVNVRVHIFSLS